MLFVTLFTETRQAETSSRIWLMVDEFREGEKQRYTAATMIITTKIYNIKVHIFSEFIIRVKSA